MKTIIELLHTSLQLNKAEYEFLARDLTQEIIKKENKTYQEIITAFEKYKASDEEYQAIYQAVYQDYLSWLEFFFEVKDLPINEACNFDPWID